MRILRAIFKHNKIRDNRKGGLATALFLCGRVVMGVAVMPHPCKVSVLKKGVGKLAVLFG